jgi:hypothetical protein
MNLPKLFSSVGLASMLAIASIVASPKPKEASAQLAEDNGITLINNQATSVAKIPSSVRYSRVPVSSPNSIVSPDEPLLIQDNSSTETSSVETLHAAAVPPNVQPQLDSKYITQEPEDGFNVVRQAEAKPERIAVRINSPEERPERIDFRINTPEEMFRSLVRDISNSLLWIVIVGVLILILGISLIVQLLKFVLWIILLPLKILISLFR